MTTTRLYPGMGVDDVRGDAGDDLVVVHDLCELSAGESLDGGGGSDTLRIPQTQAYLENMGVDISGFETVIVDVDSTCEADCTLPCDEVDPDFSSLADPTAWTVPTTGPRFRRTTSNEQENNGWRPGSYLVEDGDLLEDLLAGATDVTVFFPDTDSAHTGLDFEKSTETAQVKKISRVVEKNALLTAATTPTVFVYSQDGYDAGTLGPIDGGWAEMIATSEGDVFLYGIYDKYRVQIGGQNPGWRIDTLSAPSGGGIDESALLVVQYLALGDFGQEQLGECDQNSASPACQWECGATMAPCDEPPPIPPPPFHCNDGLDNDGDGVPPDNLSIDSGDAECAEHNEYGCNLFPHSHHWESGESFAIMGTARYCTYEYFETGSWFAPMLAQGWKTAALVNMLGPFTPDVPEHRLRFVAGGCWVFPSPQDADDCDRDGTCSAFAGSYPYADAGNSSSNYYGNVWLDVDHAAAVGLGEPLSLATVVHLGDSGNGNDLDCMGEEGAACCGAEASSNENCTLDGASVVTIDDDGCVVANLHAVIAHEFGHGMGLNHDNGTSGPTLSGGLSTSFMNESAGLGAGLCGANQAQLTGALGSGGCPRLPGFGYVGGASCGNCSQATCN